MRTVPFLDVGATYSELSTEIDVGIARVLSSGRYLLGPELEAFESSWARYCGTKHAIGVGSGLDALVLILMALDVGPGSEVIVPANTFIATWLAVSEVGATIVPVDPDPATMNLTPESIAAAVTPRTAAIMPVHLYGSPCDLAELDRVGSRLGLPVVYDAAQAHGATFRSSPVGAYGTASTWSFYPGKNLGAFGDGGAVTTNDSDVDRRLRALRNYGSEIKYRHDVRGRNSRLSELDSVVLRCKLERLDEWNRRRDDIANLYLGCLLESTMSRPSHQRVLDEAQPSWHLFVIRTSDRDMVAERFLRSGIETGIHYPIPPHQQGAYQSEINASFPVSEALSQQLLSLPIGPHLSDSDVERVCRALEDLPEEDRT